MNLIDWHKKIIKKWRKKLGISPYLLLWIAFVKGSLLTALFYHYFYKNW